ncbi:MAG TPA: bifunctional DedA family/phosphatase PAP2 family protein [Solirubrobacteraceae bacterium]|nr:bifunctional DedA family/phosphatase PAP2 family protein [Solirubrobacteraceae bacterium]
MKWGWLLGAVALAGFLLARYKRLERWLQIAGWIAVAGAAAIGAGLIPLPNLEKLLEDAGQALGAWTYLLVGVLAFLETGAFVGFIAPGETAVIVGGLVAGQGEISLAVLIAIVWACAVAGDTTSFVLGRRLGRDWLLRHGARLKITDERLKQVEGYFERRGGPTILIGRFIGFVRPLAPFLAGAAGMPLRRFLPYDVLGAGLWTATFATLGYVFWHSFDQLTAYVSRGLFAFGTFVAVVALLVWLVRLRRSPEMRQRVQAWADERRDEPGWRYVIRVGGPLWRFVGKPTALGAEFAARFGRARLTPGELGLELTTMLALLAVGGFTFFFVGDIASQPGIPGIDTAATDLAERLRSAMLVDVAKVVTDLGSLTVVIAVTAATAAWAALRRRWIDVVTLIVGQGLLVLCVQVAKAAYDRDRPFGGLVNADYAAYPSGHTAYAVTLVACATVLVRAGSGWAVRFAAVTVATILVAVVGATRVYLGVHYLSDVIGGAALGVAIWSFVGALALVGGYVRQNGARTR